MRLTALFVCILGATLLFFSYLLYNVFEKANQREFDGDLLNYAVDVANAIDFDLFGDLSLDPKFVYEEQKVFPFSLGHALFQIRRYDGVTLARSRELAQTDLPFTQSDLNILKEKGKAFKNLDPNRIPVPNKESVYRLVYYLIHKQGYPLLVLQIAVPKTFIEVQKQGLLTFFFITIPLILLVSAVGGYIFARRALRPVSEIIEKTNDINAGSLSDRIPIPAAKDEISRLAVTINNLLNRLQQAFDSQERFIADASHQLKTPLAILRGELDVLMNRDRPKEELSQFLISASQEISVLSRTVEDLLLLARMDAGTGTQTFSDVRVDEVVLAETSRLEKLAKKKNIKLHLDLLGLESELPVVKGDRYLLASMFYNFIENAIKYSPVDETVRIMVESQATEVLFSVSDKGAGIPKESVPNIFNRFYRVSSVKQNTEGVGLGLSIARKIATIHGAAIEVSSSEGKGSIFLVKIKKI